MNNGLLQMKDLVRCAKCERYKPSSEFNTDNSKANGLTSYCKICNIEHAKDWRGDKMKDDNKDLVGIYKEAYIEGWFKSTSETKTGKSRDARNYANSLFPECKDAITAYAYYVRGDIKKSDVTELGNKLVHALRHAVPADKNKSRVKPQKSDGGSTFMSKFELWVKTNDFVPSDDALFHFGDIGSDSTVRRARMKLRDAGYEFAQVENGWTVTQRPIESKKIDDMSKDELIMLLRKLID